MTSIQDLIRLRLETSKIISPDRIANMLNSLTGDEVWAWASLYACDTPQKRDILLKDIKDRLILKSGELESLERKQRIMTNILHEYLQTHGAIFF